MNSPYTLYLLFFCEKDHSIYTKVNATTLYYTECSHYTLSKLHFCTVHHLSGVLIRASTKIDEYYLLKVLT